MARAATDSRKSVSFGESKSKYSSKARTTVSRSRRQADRLARGSPEPQQKEKGGNEKQVVSIAGVFKQKGKARDLTRDKKRSRRREPSPDSTPEPDFLMDFEDGIEEARSAILTASTKSLDAIKTTITNKLNTSSAADKTFINILKVHLETLGADPAEEEIETVVQQNNKRVTKIVKIGTRIAGFATVVEDEAAKLKEYWKQWDELQEEYLKLGVEVFGAEKFGEDGEVVKGIKREMRKEMELIDIELRARVEEVEGEVDGLSGRAMQRMKASEKELDLMTKREQTKLLQSLLQD